MNLYLFCFKKKRPDVFIQTTQTPEHYNSLKAFLDSDTLAGLTGNHILVDSVEHLDQRGAVRLLHLIVHLGVSTELIDELVHIGLSAGRRAINPPSTSKFLEVEFRSHSVCADFLRSLQICGQTLNLIVHLESALAVVLSHRELACVEVCTVI